MNDLARRLATRQLMPSRHIGACLAIAAVLSVAACSTEPLAPPVPMEDDGPVNMAHTPGGTAAFEHRLRERAASQGRQGRLAEAATSWEVLTVLRPDTRSYREHLDETRRLIDAAVPERLQRGAQALKRGELDAAATQYLSALSLQPDNAQAADALRNIERERNKRSFLGKPSRVTLTRRATSEAQASAHAQSAGDRNELEHAALLGAQGETDDAIALLERHLATDRHDAAACRQLADMYFQKAEKQIGHDKAGAIASLEKSQRLDASNTRAAQRLKQLKGPSVAAAGVSVSPVASREGCVVSR